MLLIKRALYYSCGIAKRTTDLSILDLPGETSAKEFITQKNPGGLFFSFF